MHFFRVHFSFEQLFTHLILSTCLLSIFEIIDDQERRHMFEGGTDTPDVLKYLAEGSGNVDDSGNFSLQVLSTALKRSHNLSLISWSSSEASANVKDPTKESGFIVNRSNHWFSIRKIEGLWWNLNSTEEVPVRITDYYLSAFLSQLRTDNYHVFIVRGTLPTYGNDMGPDQGGVGNWHLASNLLANASKPGTQPKEPPKFAGVGRRLGGEKESVKSETADLTAEELGYALGEDVDPELEAAIRLSMMDVVGGASGSSSNSSGGGGVTSSSSAVSSSSSTSVSAPMSKKDEIRAMRLAAAEKRAKELSSQVLK